MQKKKQEALAKESLTEKRSLIDKRIFGVFLFSCLCVSSFTYSSSLLDVDFTPRMILYGTVGIVFSIALLLQFQKNNSIDLDYFKQPVFILFGVLILAFCFSYFKSVNPDDAVFSLLKMLQLFTLFVFLLLLLHKQQAPIELIAKCIMISVGIFSVIACWQIYQEYGLAKLNKTKLELGYTIYSSHANKNTFTECLLLSIPFLIYGVLFFKNNWKYGSVAALLMSIGFILVLKSVSVFLALSITLFSGFLLFLRYISNNRKLSKIIFRIAPLIIVLFISVLSFTNNPVKTKVISGIQYLKGNNYTGSGENSSLERLMLWKGTIKMIRENPLAGKGLDNWKILFPEYHSYDTRYLQYDSTKFTRPHCDYLFLWCETGLLGFLAFIGVFIAGLFYSFKIIKSGVDRKEKSIGVFLFCGTMSYSIIALSGFPTERIFNVFLLIIYLSLVIFYSKRETTKGSPFLPKFLLMFFFILTGIISFLSITYSWNRMKSEVALQRFTNRNLKRDYSSMLRYVHQMDEKYFPVDYVSMPIAWHKATAFFLNNDIKSALEQYKKAEEVSPFNVQVLTDIGTCYDQLGDKESAKWQYQKALQVNPYYPDARLNLTAIVFNEGKFSSSYAMLKAMPVMLKSLRRSKFEHVIFSQLADSVYQSMPFNKRDTLMYPKIQNVVWLRTMDSLADATKTPFIEVLKNKFSHSVPGSLK